MVLVVVKLYRLYDKLYIHRFCSLFFCNPFCVCLDRTPHWKTIVTNGALPSPRTYHTTSACLGNRLFVFSGGEIGATPVSDSKLHIFDAGFCQMYLLFIIIVTHSAS